VAAQDLPVDISRISEVLLGAAGGFWTRVERGTFVIGAFRWDLPPDDAPPPQDGYRFLEPDGGEIFGLRSNLIAVRCTDPPPEIPPDPGA